MAETNIDFQKLHEQMEYFRAHKNEAKKDLLMLVKIGIWMQGRVEAIAYKAEKRKAGRT